MITVELIRGPGAAALYVQLYELLKRKIESGELVADQKLPSKKKLASHLHVSVKTVENAYFQLSLEGYIYSREKVGYFVSNIQGFYRGVLKEKPVYHSKYHEDTYRLDIKANMTPIEMFPLSVWTRLGREVAADEGRRLLETVPFNGVEQLRKAIADHLRDFRGMEVSPDQVIIGSGTEYLYQRLIHLLGSECVVGMEDPGYSHIKKILTVENVQYRCIPMDESGICVDKLEMSDCIAVHVSPMHHFPLGLTMPVQRRVELLQWVNKKPGCFIIEDDYNCEYIYQGAPVPPLYKLDVRQRVIYMNTFSKSVAPSIRVAYMVLPESLMDQYLNTMSFYSCTVSSEVQFRLARFISGGHFERYIHRVRQRNIEQRKIVQEGFERSIVAQKAHLIKNVAGTHFLVRLETTRSDKYVKDILLRHGILASFVSEFCEQVIPGLEHLLILNYSRIIREDIDYLTLILDKALQE